MIRTLAIFYTEVLLLATELENLEKTFLQDNCHSIFQSFDEC